MKMAGKVYSIVLVISTTVFTLPILITLIEGFICDFFKNTGFECGSAAHYIFCVVSIILLFVHLGITILYFMFDQYKGINYTCPWKQRRILVPILKLVKKIVIAILQCMVSTSLGIVLLCLATLVDVMLLGDFLVYECYYYDIVQNLEILAQLIITWWDVMIAISLALNQRLMFITVSPIIMVMWYFCTLYIKKKRMSFAKDPFTAHTLTNPTLLEMFTRLIIKLIKNEKSIYTLNTSGLIINHKRYCFKSICQCDSLYDPKELKKNEIIQKKSYSNLNSSMSNLSDEFRTKRKTDDQSENKSTLLASFINDELSEWLSNFNNNADVHFLRSVICDDLLAQKCKSLFEIMKAEECNPNMMLQFQMFAIKIKIKKDMLADDLKKESNSKNSFMWIVKYYEMLIDIQNYLLEAIDKYEEFWEEMKLPNPTFWKFIDIICTISDLNEKIKSDLQSIQIISSNEIKATVLYSLYLKMIEEDYFAANEQYIKFKSQSSLSRNIYDENENKYGASAYIGVVMMSGSKTDVGRIMNCNQEIVDVLGYKKEELANCNVSMLMPSLMAQNHNMLIEKFYDKNAQLMRLAFAEKMEIALHKTGYIVPITIMFRMTQNFIKGIAFLGFISKTKTLGELRLGDERSPVAEAYIFLLSTDNTLLGFNKEFAQLFTSNMNDLNIRRYLNRDQKLDISTYFPEVFKSENESHIYEHTGLFMDADMGSLKDTLEVIIKDSNQSLKDNEKDAIGNNSPDETR